VERPDASSISTGRRRVRPRGAAHLRRDADGPTGSRPRESGSTRSRPTRSATAPSRAAICRLEGRSSPAPNRPPSSAASIPRATAIAHGEIFQAVLSQRFEQRFEGDPFTLYRVLRLANPSPHMFFFEADG
jgi:hypothetical protein